MATGKSRHITGCTLCVKDISLLWTLQCGPAVSIIESFHYNGFENKRVYTIIWYGVGLRNFWIRNLA